MRIARRVEASHLTAARVTLGACVIASALLSGCFDFRSHSPRRTPAPVDAGGSDLDAGSSPGVDAGFDPGFDAGLDPGPREAGIVDPRCTADAGPETPRADAGARSSVYVKASNSHADDMFGNAVALSTDGRTLAVGAPGKASSATGEPGSGAVYVFVREGSAWAEQAYLEAATTDAGDSFGIAVALSADGSTLAVGATGEASRGSGVDADPANDDLPQSGAAYVFTRSGTSWTQQAYLKSSDTSPSDRYGSAVALSADGSMLAVGAPSPFFPTVGDVHVYTRSGASWSLQTRIEAPGAERFGSGPLEERDAFGASVALSADGSMLAVGASAESSSATGVGGDSVNNDAVGAGAVYVFVRAGARWSQQAYVKASNTSAADAFGSSVALSSNGSTLSVGAPREASSATGIGGDQANDDAGDAGAVYVFTRDGATWTQQAYVKASNASSPDRFGSGVSLSADGSTLAVAAPHEASSATGLGGDESDDGAANAGAVYLFERTASTWAQRVYLKADNTDAGDLFGGPDDPSGRGVALSGEAATLVVGASAEASRATGIDGDLEDDCASNAGAAYVYAWHPGP